ncbi:MAG: tetratricopeptide repeat protein [Candidatus Omnitrophota bacterium]
MTKIFSFVICTLVLFCHLSFGICHSVYAEDAKEAESLFVAKKAYEDGFYEVSLGLLERFLKNYPSSDKIAEANLLVAECYYHQDRFLEALPKLELLLNDSRAAKLRDAILYWIAEVHFKGNDFSKAAEFYRKIVDTYPKSAYAVSAYYSLGWCLFQEQKYKEAMEYFNLVEQKFPNEPFARDSAMKIVECLYNLKDYADLKNRSRLYIKTNAKDNAKVAFLYFYLAEADYYLNNFNDAVDSYNKVISRISDERIKALSGLGLGWSYLKLKQYNQAQEAFSGIKQDDLDKKSLSVLLLGQAILMTESKRFSEAGIFYDKLLETADDEVALVQAYLGKADALYNIAEYKEAENAYRQALEKAGDNIPQEITDKLHYGIAWVYLKQGKFKEAIDEFQKVARSSDDMIVKVSALCQIGDTYKDSGDLTKAIEVYDNILKNYPDSIYGDYVQYQLGLALLKNSNYDAAILAFKSLQKNFPRSKLLDDAYYSLGLAHFQREDYTSSKEVFERFQDEFKESNLKPQALYLLGTSLYNLGRFEEAVEVFKNIARIYSQDSELAQKAEYEIADCYDQMGNEKEAMERFKALRSKYPDSSLTPEVVWWLGEYYYRNKDFGLSRRYFNSLIQDFPRSDLVASSYYALASTYEEESKYAEAISNFNKVIGSGSADLVGQAAVAIGNIYAKQNEFEAALKSYKEVADKYPNLAGLIYPKMAEMYYKSGDSEEAIKLYRKTMDMVPVKQMSEVQFKIAEIAQAKGNSDEAIGEYLKVTYLYSENEALTVKALLRVASIYEERKDFKEAAKIYLRVISMKTQEAKFAQDRLEWIRANTK